MVLHVFINFLKAKWDKGGESKKFSLQFYHVVSNSVDRQVANIRYTTYMISQFVSRVVANLEFLEFCNFAISYKCDKHPLILKFKILNSYCVTSLENFLQTNLM